MHDKRVVPKRVPQAGLQKAPGLLKPPSQSTHRASLRIDKRNFVYVGPVKIGRYVPDRQVIQVKDKCKPRSQRAGTALWEVSIDEFAKLQERKQ